MGSNDLPENSFANLRMGLRANLPAGSQADSSAGLQVDSKTDLPESPVTDLSVGLQADSPVDLWKHGMLSVASMFQKIDWRKSVQSIYSQIANGLIESVSCDSVSIRLLALTGDEMVGYVYAGEAERLAKEQFPTLSVGTGRMSSIFEEHKPLVYDFNAPEDNDVRSEDGIRLGYGYAVVMPLVVGGSPIGAIDFMFKQGKFVPGPEQLLFLGELCRILAPIVNALSIADDVVELRASEEAERIGAELHDNFAQPLSVIALESDKAILAQEDGDNDQLRESLTKISILSRRSFDMMADEVAMLHSASRSSDDLIKDIRRYVESFQGQWGVSIELEVPDVQLTVSDNVGNQAMRILHEALSNVLRHSRASSAKVTLRVGRGAMSLSIEDGGCGFDLKERTAKQLGLQIMEKRAESVGGRLTIASVVGEGTSVVADLPLIA